MLKSTLQSGVPATFNMALLFESVACNKVDKANIIHFLKNRNIRDYRIGAGEALNKGHSFCDLSVDLAHHLFDSINFHQLFGTDEPGFVIQRKMEVYNDVVTHLKFHMLTEGRNALVKNTSEYHSKVRSYIKPMIFRSVNLHMSIDQCGVVNEGVENFWYIVDHYIFTNKVKYELQKLKTVIANAD